jgi:hypothetical protein
VAFSVSDSFGRAGDDEIEFVRSQQDGSRVIRRVGVA